MEKRKINKNSKFNLMVLLVSLLAVAVITTTVLAVTGAWFTGRKNAETNITTATVSVEAKQDGQVVRSAITPITLTATTDETQDLIDEKPITINSTSNIPVYVRVVITLNWAENNASYDDVYDCLNVEIKQDTTDAEHPVDIWKSSGSSNFGAYLYLNTQLSANAEQELISSIKLANGKSMPSNVELNVFAEVVQADNIGKARLQESDANLTDAKWTEIFG